MDVPAADRRREPELRITRAFEDAREEEVIEIVSMARAGIYR